ncbi:MBOAT family protein [bacterium 1XD8-76]|nr:MBOAT family protein [bacterium 1XD8-76]
MVFSSLEFLFLFVPLFLLVYYLLPLKAKNVFLFLGSLVFYGFGISWNAYYMGLIIASVVVNFLAAKGIEHCRRRRRIKKGEEIAGERSAGEKVILMLGLCYNFGFLLFFKYAGFFVKDIVLPIGISFYTFQITSYLIDVYKRKNRAEQDIIRLGAYLTMFPQLIAGPIVTYREVHRQLRKRKITLLGCNHGLQIFTLGLGFKVLLANQLGNLWEDIQTIGYESISTPLAWLGILAFSLQIYFDFYGYSLMAVGLGKLLGFRIPDNFRQPYMSLSMTEFWRRWHITLGRWFREYVYIPLGGNRKGKTRQIFNMLVVWLLTGLWHGANWNFILWGFFLFLVLCIEKAGLIRLLERFKVIGHLYMCFLIPFSWTLFGITDFIQLRVYLLKMFPFLAGNGGNHVIVFEGDFIKYINMYGVGMLVGLICCTGLAEKIFMRWRNKFWMSVLLLIIFSASILCMYRGLNDPFLYYRF